MALVSHALDYFHLREDLKHLTADLDEDKHHRMHRALKQQIKLRLLGDESVKYTALLNDPASKALFEWGKIIHPSTFGRRLSDLG